MTETSNISFTAKFDIIGFAVNVIKEVEKIRAFIVYDDDSTKNNFNLPVESRLNTFFRLVGLPMFVTVELKNEENKPKEELNGDVHLTPGYSRSFGRKLSYYNIKNSEDLELKLLSRESILLDAEGEIGSEYKNNSMTMAIKDPLSLEPNVPDTEDVTNFNLITDGGERLVFKRLIPLITCYIKGGILPISNELARPFLSDPKEQMPNDDVSLQKPFIESVVRVRLVSMGNQSAEQQANQDQFFESIKIAVGGEDAFNTIFIKNEELFQKTDLLERYVINKLLASIGKLADKWVELKKKRERLRNDISFKVSVQTSSGKSSPFGKRVAITADSIMAENSEIGNKLKTLRADEARESAILSLLSTDDTSTNDINSKLKNTKNVSHIALISSFISLVSNDLNQIKKNISDIENNVKNKAQELENLRLELEMMTGEFTGLSVPDIVIVITALYLIKKEDLVALLDKDIRDDMKKDKVLATALGSYKDFDTADAFVAIDNLGVIVKQLYNLLNNSIKLAENRDQRSRKIPNSKK